MVTNAFDYIAANTPCLFFITTKRAAPEGAAPVIRVLQKVIIETARLQ